MHETLLLRLKIIWAVWSYLEVFGDMVGHRRTTASGQNYYMAFEGIRYAKPPVGENSFRDPVSFDYSGNLNRKVYCMDVDPKDGKVFGEEDCLCLNVYTPEPYVNKRMPVLIWIDGNLYPWVGGKINYEPKRLMDERMVFVTISYRIGPLGFASLENVNFRGNFGLKDQEMAIDWVIKYIPNFGGDPRKITLGGEGLGAAFVLHHINGVMKARIKRGIALSGSRFAPWAFGPKSWVTGRTIKIGDPFYCDYLNCFRRTKADGLVLESYKMRKEQLIDAKQRNAGILQRNMFLPFLPVVDGIVVKFNPWKDPGKVNFSLLLGLKKDEGVFMDEYVNRYNWTDAIVKSIFNSRVDYEGMTGKPFDRKDSTNREQLADLYKEEDSLKSKNLRNLAGDGWFVFPAMAEAKYHVGSLTGFMFDDKNSSDVFSFTQYNLPFLTYNCTKLDEECEQTASKMIRLISNFVLQRDLELKPYSEDKEVFDITQALLVPSGFQIIDTGISKRMKKWKSLHMLKLRTH
ncbi:cholinesterase 1-like [Cimex lectularius]|uniref:Carboxylesterase type B domain-containing protein n=1 Tax=Cimex lectularius TaxID=79782 RepID=A0A8I6S6I4_CIMLE|nr:cholinesterase 1-like [Cimex lectularius]